ncbi:hypothetical protein PIB30_076204 [Stylosanthes scabra]|uniref:Uncharacterized protein n=1 Tax=Stylosanthes scabra TaxID=79078 RepID=A0ABU6XS10_9FABA|nr:hypothetical protein [Stylosanthes scabra]
MLATQITGQIMMDLGLCRTHVSCNLYGIYLQGVWDYRRNRWCQDGRLEVYVKGGEFGSSGPNIRNSCPELKKADVSDVPGFVSCQTSPEGHFVVMPSHESFFWKLLKTRH